MKTLRILLFALLCAAAPASATHETGTEIAAFGVDALGQAALTMAGNPPLPMIDYKQGTWKVSVMPAYFFGKPGGDYGSDVSFGGRFSGFGAGASGSYAFADRWGVYAFGVATRLKGDFNFTQTANCALAGCFDTRMSGTAGLQFMSVGAAYQVSGQPGAGGNHSSVFLGPHILRQTAFQMIRRTQGGALQDDYDMEIDDISPGLLFGAQAGFNVKSFQFNPFFLAIATFGDICKPYSVPRQGADSGLSQQPNQDCNVSRKLHLIDETNLAGGLNLIYKPWNLSVNLTAPFLGRLIGDGDAKLTLLTFTKSFDNFSR